MLDSALIIQHYKEAFRKFQNDGVIDLDHRIPYPFSFHIYRLEHILKELAGVLPPNRQSQHYIALVKKGAGLKTIGLTRFPIADNTLLIVPKRVMHASMYSSSDFCGFVLCFNLDFFLQQAFPVHLINKHLANPSLRPYITLSNEQVSKLQPIFEDLLIEYSTHQNNGATYELAAVKILELLIQCDRFFQETVALNLETDQSTLVNTFNEQVENRFKTQRNVKFYADQLHVHPNYLNRLIKTHTGSSVKKLIQERILLEACYLLIHSQLSIKEIAHELGFSNADYFSSAFKSFLGRPPRQYRLKPS